MRCVIYIFNKAQFDTQTLLHEPLSIALPPNHPLLNRDSISLIDLKNEDFLMPYTTLGHGISDFIIEGCESLGFKPNIIYEVSEILPMLDMVWLGLDVEYVPELFIYYNGLDLHI